MEITPVDPPVVQSVRFFPDLENIEVLYQNGTSETFRGLDNLKIALTAVDDSPLIVGDMSLTNQNGDPVLMIVPKNVASETIRNEAPGV